LHQSDQGCTYAREDDHAALVSHGITCSLSRGGNGYGNAAMESFPVTVKREEGGHFESFGDAVRFPGSSVRPSSNDRQ